MIILDRHSSEANPTPGLIVHVPLHQQIILNQPTKDEEAFNPLATLFKKLRRIKNSIFQHSDSSNDKSSDTKNDKMNGVFIFAHHPGKVDKF